MSLIPFLEYNVLWIEGLCRISEWSCECVVLVEYLHPTLGIMIHLNYDMNHEVIIKIGVIILNMFDY